MSDPKPRSEKATLPPSAEVPPKSRANTQKMTENTMASTMVASILLPVTWTSSATGGPDTPQVITFLLSTTRARTDNVHDERSGGSAHPQVGDFLLVRMY